MCFHPPSLLIGKVLGTCDALLYVSHTLQRALESGQEDRIVQPLIGSTIRGFSTGSAGIGGSVSSILTQFLSNRSQHVIMDGCRRKKTG